MERAKKYRFIVVASTIFLVLVGYTTGIAKTEDEENNISIYRQVGPGVVNITSVVVERDFFFNPIPREGAGSGSIIDTTGHIKIGSHLKRWQQMACKVCGCRSGQ
jgi:hypothetical protein